MPDDKRKLAKTIAALQMRFGTRAVRRLGEQERARVARLETGFPPLDGALGGGLPCGRITEIACAPTAGATTLALKVVAQAQVGGETAVYLDLERSFDPDYAARCGVDLSRLLLVRPHDAQQACALLRDFAGASHGVLVCDLPPAITADPGLAQTLVTTLGRLLLPLGRSSTVLLCLISLPLGREGPAPRLPWQHYAAVRLLLQRERWLRRGEDIRGYRVQTLVAKNKWGAAGETVTVDITLDGVVAARGEP